MYPLYAQPSDRLKQSLWYALPRFLRGQPRQFYREFWALREINFEVKRGETVGIIGRNGSGKSTLLQIIAGTLTPTVGEVQVDGRVAALLELGSGFNPEFTGRENVYLNGSILGMSQGEIDEIYDDILAFADIGQFIDQPVKLYSNGMLVRLAFAVQAFVPKEVLIVDEALAVGDMFFQAKCITRMKRLLDEGVTVLFVSHDTGTVKSFCRQAILLEQGQLIEHDSADKVVEKYFALRVRGEQSTLATPVELGWLESSAQSSINQIAFTNNAEFQKRASFERIQNGKARFVNVQLLNQAGQEIAHIEYEQEVALCMALEVCQDIPSVLGFGYHIRDYNGVDIIYSDSAIENKAIIAPRKGERYLIEWRFRAALKAGNYTIATVLGIPINLSLSQVDFCDFVPLAVQFNMAPRPESYLYGAVHWDNRVEVYRY